MSEPTTQERLERQRWAIATVRSRRRQAKAGIGGLLVLVPLLVWLTGLLPSGFSGFALLTAFALTCAGYAWLVFRASRCPVCSAQHAEGGHGLLDTMRYRTGQPQIGRTPGFICSSCGTRLT